MAPVPWTFVHDWVCLACGVCCKGYDVVLEFPEWVRIVKAYGVGYTEPGISRLYLKHKDDGTCAFLYNLYGKWACSLQPMKPIACKLWPFKISDNPKYGKPNQALYYTSDQRKLYVYVDPACIGLQWGTPNQNFQTVTVPEFVDLALGLRRKQFYSTSQLPSQQPWSLNL
jgi:Fe-S-cluster containining protein